MMRRAMKTFEARTADEWRRWLDEHHASASEIWLVFRKKHTGVTSIAFEDALDEALCFGWVDSLIKRMDDERYARKFTPRKADSRWSDINRKRYKELKRAGRLDAAGIDRPPTNRGYAPPPVRPQSVPRYIRTAIARHPAARRHFEKMSPTHRLRYAHWVDSAKKRETKQRRLAEAIRLLTAGKPLGLK